MTKTTKSVVVSLFILVNFLALSPATVAAQKTVIGKIIQPLSAINSSEYTLKLDINGQVLRLNLHPGSVIGSYTKVANLAGHSLNSLNNRFRSFRGSIHGESDSWVRLAIHGGTLSGVISRQGNRYQLGGTSTSLITLKPLSEAKRFAANSHSLKSHADQLRQQQSTKNASASMQVSHVVDMAIIVDSQYNELHNGNGLQKALSIINSVDGIYREEFGIALRVVSALNVSDLRNDPFDFGNVTIEKMLRGLRDYRMRSKQFDDASLVHLFTGNRNSDAPVGLAWIDTACRSDGYDVGLSTPYRHEILLAAHEIAHNLGAQHDTDTACRVDNDKVMWPFISSHTSQNFSSCTRSSVRQSLQNSCHVKTRDVQVSLLATQPAQPNR